jgi:hypothetical protein
LVEQRRDLGRVVDGAVGQRRRDDPARVRVQADVISYQLSNSSRLTQGNELIG